MSGGEAVSIVTFAGGRARVDTQVLNRVLDAVGSRPFAIYSINGNKRTGKSFMLNYFLRYLTYGTSAEDWMTSTLRNEFHWRGGSDRDTTGINIWSAPFFVNVGGKDVAVLLMDTQGSFDDETTMTQNATVFALSTLLSSVLTFNAQNDVGEDSLQFLQFFSNYAMMASEGGDEDQFQKLVFLIRDFAFPDYAYGYYDDHHIPKGQSKNFKQEKLDAKDTQPPEIQYVHNQIVSSYGEVGAYLMPDPGKELKRNSQIDRMDSEFREHVREFVELMLSSKNLVTKKVGGQEVNGTQFKKYVEGWAKLFHTSELPEVKSILTSAADTQYVIAKSIAIGSYKTEMQKFLADNSQGVSVDILEKKRDQLTHDSTEMFHRVRRLGGPEYKEKFIEEFADEIEKMYSIDIQLNRNNLQSTEMTEQMEAQRLKLELFEEAKERSEAQLQEMNNQVAAGVKNVEDIKVQMEAQAQENALLEEGMSNTKQKLAEMEKNMALEKERSEQEIRRIREEAAQSQRAGTADTLLDFLAGMFPVVGLIKNLAK